MSTYGEDYDRRLEELVVKHNELVRAYEAKTVQEHDLAIWWEAYQHDFAAILSNNIDVSRTDIEAGYSNYVKDHGKVVANVAKDIAYISANMALAAYKAKAAELRGK